MCICAPCSRMTSPTLSSAHRPTRASHGKQTHKHESCQSLFVSKPHSRREGYIHAAALSHCRRRCRRHHHHHRCCVLCACVRYTRNYVITQVRFEYPIVRWVSRSYRCVQQIGWTQEMEAGPVSSDLCTLMVFGGRFALISKLIGLYD